MISRALGWLQRRRAASSEAAAIRAWRAAHCGPGVWLDPTVQVLGWRRVRIGAHSIISEGGWLNVNDRDADEPVIVIGASCFLGRRNFLSAGSLIEIGDYCLTGVDCHFLGSDHVFSSPFVPYLMSGTTDGGHIRIGANCWLGASVTVLKGVSIGYGSIIGAGSVVKSDVPPMSIAVGNPARLVRRFDLPTQTWVRAEEYMESAIPDEAAYLAQLKEQWPVIRGPRVASGYVQGDL